MDRQFPKPRKSGSFSAIVGVALSAFALGALIVGYLTWDGTQLFGSSSDEAEIQESETPALDAPAAPDSDASPTPAESEAADQDEDAAETGAEAEASEAVERVAEQQGGLDQRLAAAEQRLARLDLQAQAASGNAARAEGLLIAFAVRRSLERGSELGYLADQLRLRFSDALPNAVDTVIAASRDPVTIDELIARLEGLTPKLIETTEEPSFEKFQRELSELFVVRRASAPSPQPERRMERARLFLQSGRVAAAIEEVKKAPGAANAGTWIRDAERYAAAQRALDLIETSAVVEPQRLRDGEGERIQQPTPGQEESPFLRSNR